MTGDVLTIDFELSGINDYDVIRGIPYGLLLRTVSVDSGVLILAHNRFLLLEIWVANECPTKAEDSGVQEEYLIVGIFKGSLVANI